MLSPKWPCDVITIVVNKLFEVLVLARSLWVYKKLNRECRLQRIQNYSIIFTFTIFPKNRSYSE